MEAFAGAVSADSAAAAAWLKDEPIPSATAQTSPACNRLSLVFINSELTFVILMTHLHLLVLRAARCGRRPGRTAGTGPRIRRGRRRGRSEGRWPTRDRSRLGRAATGR